MVPPDHWAAAVRLMGDPASGSVDLARALVEDDSGVLAALYAAAWAHGHADGVLDGMEEQRTVLDDAAALLAAQRPLQAFEQATARAKAALRPAGPVPDPRRCLDSWASPAGAT